MPSVDQAPPPESIELDLRCDLRGRLLAVLRAPEGGPELTPGDSFAGVVTEAGAGEALDFLFALRRGGAHPEGRTAELELAHTPTHGPLEAARRGRRLTFGGLAVSPTELRILAGPDAADVRAALAALASPAPRPDLARARELARRLAEASLPEAERRDAEDLHRLLAGLASERNQA